MTKYLVSNIFHVFNKSIANFGIFNNAVNCQRFLETLDYYNNNVHERYSRAVERKRYSYENLLIIDHEKKIKFIAYCLMPDHYHVLIKILQENILSKYINDIENSYSRYFNIKHKRKGPLWQTAFKSVQIQNNEQLLHVTRYIHLNPVTNYLVDDPSRWVYSSYKDYIENKDLLRKTITEVSIPSRISYKRFVENQKDYQRRLKEIKKQILE